MDSGYLADLARWPAGSHSLYAVVMAVLLALLLLSALGPVLPRPWQKHTAFLDRRPVFYGILGLFIVLGRSPSYLALELNVDESIFLTGAITLAQDPAPWVSVETTTSGLLHILAPLLALPLGLPLDYASWRLIAALLLTGSLVFYGETFRTLFNTLTARIVVLPFAVNYALMDAPFLLAHNTEIIATFLLAAAVFLLVRAFCGGIARHPWLVFAGAVFLGLVPHSKMQAVPLGLFYAATAGLVLLWLLRSAPGKVRFKLLTLYVAGGLLPTIVILIYVSIAGAWESFVWSTFIVNFDYSAMRDVYFPEFKKYAFPRMIGELPGMVMAMPTIRVMLPLVVGASAALIGVYTLVPRLRAGIAHRHWAFLAFSLVTLVVALLVFAAPGRYYSHYLEFLLIPAVFLLGSSLALIFAPANAGPGGSSQSELTPSAVSRSPRHLWAAVAVLGILVILPATLFLSRPHVMLVLTKPNVPPPGHDEPLVTLLRNIRQPEDKLIVYGFMHRYHVETALPMGYPGLSLEQVVIPIGDNHFDRNRFLRHIRRQPPEFFIDTTFSAFSENPETPEFFPAFAAFLQQEYTVLPHEGAFPLYIRNDRREQLLRRRENRRLP